VRRRKQQGLAPPWMDSKTISFSLDEAVTDFNSLTLKDQLTFDSKGRPRVRRKYIGKPRRVLLGRHCRFYEANG
jgi:hypothetical protein